MRQQLIILGLIQCFGLIHIHLVQADPWENNLTEQRFAQLSFITPIGSNGWRSATVSNRLSLNILVGVSGGLDGVELGGIHNITKGDVRGLQVGGLGNLTTGISRGVQMAGWYNLNFDLTTGLQLAGITNVVRGFSKGVHLAGINNFVDDESWSFQVAGITNISPGGNHGLQIAGITNINGGEGEGIQIAGLVNVNYGKTSKFQAAGLVNVSREKVKGIQIAGIANYTKELSGFQLGLINVSDTVRRGIPLGLISVVKHGYYAFELEANDAFWINANYKMGVSQLYNIFTVGFKRQNSNEMWGVGLGLGSLMSVSEKWGLNFDLTATHVNENEWWTDQLNLLNRLKINAWLEVGNIRLYGGPSLNVHVSNLRNAEGIPGGNLIDPRLSFYKGTHKNTRTVVYPGFNFGVRL